MLRRIWILSVFAGCTWADAGKDHPEWPEEERELLKRGRVSIGMSADQVQYWFEKIAPHGFSYRFGFLRWAKITDAISQDHGLRRVYRVNYQIKSDSCEVGTLILTVDISGGVLVEGTDTGGFYGMEGPCADGWPRLRNAFPGWSAGDFAKIRAGTVWVGMTEDQWKLIAQCHMPGSRWTVSRSPELIIYTDDNFDTFTFDRETGKLRTWIVHSQR